MNIWMNLQQLNLNLDRHKGIYGLSPRGLQKIDSTSVYFLEQDDECLLLLFKDAIPPHRHSSTLRYG